MPEYLSIGVSEEKFWDSCPRDLEPYLEAEKLRMKRIDQLMWQNGLYTLRAVSVNMSSLTNGKLEYFDKPMMEQIEIENTPLTEEEKEEQTKALFLRLQIMESNFNRSKGEVGA